MTEREAKTSRAHASAKRFLRSAAALLPPLIAVILQWAFFPIIHPYIWYLFYPAVFVSSWIGGLRSGLIATALCAGLVLWFFAPPQYSMVKEVRELLPALVFICVGCFFSVLHDRARKARQRAADALAAAQLANERSTRAMQERRILAALVDASSDFIGVADADGKPIYLNPAGRRMVGLTPDQNVEGTQVLDYYPPDLRSFAADVILKSMIEQGHWRGETRFRHWQTQAAIPVSDEHFMIGEPETGRLLGMGTITRDITDITRAREEMEAAHRKLEQANQEITRLYERTKELDNIRTQFVASVSHELRTPLSLILGPTERLLGAPDMNEEARRDLAVVARNARTLLGHVNDLLDASKLDAGRMKADYVDTDLTHLIRFVASHFEVLAQEKAVTYTLEIPEGLRAQVDPDKLRRILLNLLSNAFKFTPDGSRVRLRASTAAGTLAIEVGDSGPGIPADQRDAIFERFRQLEGGGARASGSAGFGLAIARDFVALHAGTISVTEAPEGGALFVVSLPQRAPAGSEVHEMAAEPFVEQTAVVVGPLRSQPVEVDVPTFQGDGRGLVLVVEDNHDMNHLICESLAPEYRVAAAYDGADGLHKTLELRPDIVLSDLMMPQMSGEDLVRELRKRDDLADTPIVVLTAKAEENLRVKLLREGAQDYLTKPFSIEELRARVGTLLSAKQAREATRESETRLRALVDAASQIVWTTDASGAAADGSESWRAFTGQTYEQEKGVGWIDALHPEDREHVRAWWKRAVETRTAVDTEYRVRHASGQWRWMAVRAVPLLRASGSVRGWVGMNADITELRRAQDELRLSRERFELALRGADLAAWDWNIRTGEMICNPRWAEMRGFRPDEIEPHIDAWIASVHPDDWPRVQETLADYFEGRSAEFESEYRVSTKDGTWIWTLDRGRVFGRDERGHPLRMVGTALDITERKRLEHELRLAEAQSSGILSISADAIISIDGEQRIILFNEGAEKIFGYAKAEAIGAPLDLLIPERLRAVHRQHVEGFAAGREVARRMGEWGTVTILGLRKNGEEFPADAAISKLDLGGKRILTVAIRDISEQKRSESEQKFLAEVGSVLASTLVYEDTLTNVAELAVRDLADICIVDIVETDGQVRRLKVVSRDPSKAWACDALTRVPLDRARPHLSSGALATRQTDFMQRLSPDTVASFAHSEEHLRALRALDIKSVIAVPLLARGELLGVIALVSSTSSPTYGPADVRLAEELGRRAALSIENARLYRAARRASQLRDEVLGVVAHDLRNPLGSILMQAELLRHHAAEPEQRPAQAIERAATRMSRLIQDLLDVTRMEAGRLPLERVRVPAGQIIVDCVEGQKALASKASLELRLDVAQDLPEIWADRDRLRQVFENLVGNAVKFTQPGGRVSIGAAAREGEVLFSVADTGAGIAEEDLPHVFDRFWQAHEGERRGTGLGLPIAKGIVEAHGGCIWVESAKGHGSTFFFTIPTAARDDQWRSDAAAHRA